MVNEVRLIDANALRDDTYILDAWDAKIVRAWLDDQPTVDAVPVVHGRWIIKGQDVFCSSCNNESGYNAWGSSAFSSYCPNCGAKMDGDGDG